MGRRSAKRSWQQLDPQFGKEREKYGYPIPSRQFILQYLDKRGMPLTHEELCAELNLDPEQEVEPFRRRLKAMERDGELIRNRRGGYGVVTRMDLVRGRVVGHAEGHGFLKPDDGSDDLYISAREMRQLMHRDIVVMRVVGLDNRGRREGTLVEVLERNTTRVVGRYAREQGVSCVQPDNRRLNQDIIIPDEHVNGATPGQIVVAEVLAQPGKRNPPIGRIREVLGDHMAPGMEVEIAIVNHNLPHVFPDEVLAEAGAFGETVPEEAIAGRLDLRDTPLVTIDGITARDFDDAVYCERKRKNWRLIVAIADVSWYVRPGTALEREAENRGTSVYFPDRVIPMLPEALSNGLCSLNPQVDRLCMACEMTVSPDGEVLRAKFHEAVMRSAARLTYDTVGEILEHQNPALMEQYQTLVPHLQELHKLYKALKGARERRGGIDFDTQETVIEYGPERKIERIVPSERNDAHRLIEECMIAANVASARYLRHRRIPALYRIHQGPNDEKLEKLLGFLGQLGLRLPGADSPSPQDYSRLLEQVKERPDFHLIQTVMLRSMNQAVYSPDLEGHFGLALEHYCHFTSPIRRYPDLLVHRAIRHLLRGGKARDFAYTPEQMVSLGEHTSMTERRADDATRDAVEWLKCEYMQDKVGEVFEGLVSGVTSFGLFVELREVFVEGLIHVTALDNDYYHFDPVSQQLRGERSGQVYQLGDLLTVRVVRVDLDDRKIDFELLTPSRGGRRSRRSRRR